MSTRTAYNYQAIIRKKMQLQNQIEFNRYAIRHGLIEQA